MKNKHKNIFILFFLIILQACDGDKLEWSPQSADLLFMSNRSGNAEIYIKYGNDTALVNLTNNVAGDNWAVWSPNGEKIVFQSTRSGNLDIWMMDKDGSNPVQLTNNESHDYLPSFIPGGSKISFTSWRKEAGDEEPDPHIYIMNSDGSDQKRLVEESMKTSAGAMWHPSGEKFLFTKKVSDKGADIFEAELNGNIIRQLTNDTLYSGGGQYSPNGKKIIYTQDDGNKTEIILMDSDGANPKVILKGGQNYYPNWSPDNKWVAITSILPNTNQKNLDIYALSVEQPKDIIPLVSGLGREAEGHWKPVIEK